MVHALASFVMLLQAGVHAPAPRMTPPAPARMDANLYFVDPFRGHDVGSGRNPSQPWRTLTYAFAHGGGAPMVVVMAPGDYSEASGESFPLRPPGYFVLSTVFVNEHGARILGPSGANPPPVFEVVTFFQQRFENLEIVTEGVAFDVTYAGGGGFSERGIGQPSVVILAEIKARRAIDVHLEPGLEGGLLDSSGSFACTEAAITLDGTWASTQNQRFEVRLEDADLCAGPSAAVLNVRAGGAQGISVTCETSALHDSGAGFWFHPRDPLDFTVEIESCVLHALGNPSLGGGTLVVDGAGALAVEIRNSIFWENPGDLDLPDYDPATYVLDHDLVQQASLIGVGRSITGDPRFVDAHGGDYHLLPDSAARGAGVATSSDRDHEGDPRGFGADDDAFDIGMDEFYPRYHWFHPRPRVEVPTTLRILGEPGDRAMAFAGSPSSVGFGNGWQLDQLLSPDPFAVAAVGPTGLAEVQVSIPRDLAQVRLRSRFIATQIRYLTEQGATEFSANAAILQPTR